MRATTTLLIAVFTAVALGGCGNASPAATPTAVDRTTTDDRTAGAALLTTEEEPSTPSPSVAEAATSAAAPSGNDATVPASTASPTLSIQMETWEFHFKPDNWAVPAGEEITIEITNRGGAEHDWTLLELGETIAKLSEFDEDMVLAKIDPVPRGDSVTETITIDEPGTYQVICSLSGHFNTGMGAALTVQ